ncbi:MULTISPECIES: hypothetical protein [Acidobacteriaceae]|uniref:hypothetical protein n=1 Tax=Acidobacteriaceae TaxID=204434 RepID=UPI00131C7F63|nr:MULTISPECIES: hypothetical protein [Acidobacteriaceae]MDW5267332.1 hypothetical protein [Edaphobacter sp.]
MKTEPKANAPNSPGKDVQGDFAQFTDFMKKLVAVPHSKIKARLEEEKRSKKKRISASPDPAV